MQPGLPNRLDHGILQAQGEGADGVRIGRRVAGQLGRPGAEHELIEQILVAPVGRSRAFDVAAARPQQAAPGLDLARPFLGQLGQHREPGPDILAMLGIMGRRAEHGVRPALRALGIGLVEGRQRQAEIVGAAAHLVEGGEAVVAVERGVLEALGHHRAAILLHPHGEARHQVTAVAAARRGDEVGREQPLQEAEDAGVQIGLAASRLRDGPVDVAAIGIGGTVRVDIGAVDRKAGDDLPQPALQDVAREVGGPRVLAGDLRRVAGEHVELARHLVFHDPELAVADDLAERPAVLREIGVGPADAGFARRVHEQAEDQVGEFIAGRAVDRPILAQRLVPRQDLLDDQIEGSWRQRAQPLQVRLGIEEPVDMVDAQAVERPVADQREDEAVGVVEQLRQLHADAGELVDVEEAAIVDVVGGDAEMRRAPMLVGDQRIEAAPAREVPGRSVDPADGGIDGLADIVACGRQAGEPGLQVPGAARGMGMPVGQAREGIADRLELGMLIAEDAAVMQWADRQLVRAIGPDGEAAGAGVEAQDELAGFQHHAVMVAEQRHQQLAMQVAPIRGPVDIEPPRVIGLPTPLQHVEPPGIVGAADAHVVRHDVQHLTKAVAPERRDHVPKCVRVAEIGIEAAMVDDVVAVRAARAGRQIGRRIDVADAELRQVRRQPRGLGEAEARAELQAVGGSRNDRRPGLSHAGERR